MGLRLASEFLDVPLPQVARNKMRDDWILAASANHSLAKITAHDPPQESRRLLFRIQMEDHLWDKACLAFGLLTDRTHYHRQWIILPAIMCPLYRALRPFRQLTKEFQGHNVLHIASPFPAEMRKEYTAVRDIARVRMRASFRLPSVDQRRRPVQLAGGKGGGDDGRHVYSTHAHHCRHPLVTASA